MPLTPEVVKPGVWRFALPSETLPPYEHTNSYVVRSGDEAVMIDAGSADPAVLEALTATLETLGVARLKALLLTHTHPDHIAGVAALSRRYGAPVYVHPLEHARLDFPAARLQGGATLAVGGTFLGVHHTPGHSPGHLSFSLPASGNGPHIVFVGDLLAATGSTWVGLPEGNVSDYLTSLAVLSTLVEGSTAVFGPGHGPLIDHPVERLEEVRAHRSAREAEVLAALSRPLTLVALSAAIYPGLVGTLTWLAEGALLAQLEKLTQERRVVEQSGSGGETTWTAANPG